MSGSIVSPFPHPNALFDLGDVYKQVNDIQTSSAYRNSLLQRAETDAAELQLKRDKLAIARAGAGNLFGDPTTDGTAPTAPPVGSPGGGFQMSLGNAESGNNSTAVNPQGYSGKYQFGAARLADLGLYVPAEGEDLKKNEWKGTFRIAPFAVSTHDDFLKNPAAQHAAFQRHVADIDQAIAGIPGAQGMDQNGLRAVAHLGGVNGMRRFIESGGVYNPADANGTRLSDYYTKFAQGGPAALQAAFGSPDAARQGQAQPPVPPTTTTSLPIPPIPPDEVPPPPVAPSRAALRTGGVDFAGPGVPAMTPPASPVTPAASPALPSPFVSMVPGGAPVAPPQATVSGPQPAVTALPPPPQNQLGPQPLPTPPTAPTPAEPPVKPDLSGLVKPPDVQANGLTRDQERNFRIAAASVTEPEQVIALRQQIEATKTANREAQRNYQSDVRTRENDARTAGNQARTARNEEQRLANEQERLRGEQQARIREDEKYRREDKVILDDPRGDPTSPQYDPGYKATPAYARAYNRQNKVQYLADGSRVEPNMSGYEPPTFVASGAGPGGMNKAPVMAPATVVSGMIENTTALRKIDDTLKELDKVKGVGLGPIAGQTPRMLADNIFTPEAVTLRALIADIGSLKLHDRSGANITANESPRLIPFIPLVTDSPETVRKKLEGFRKEYLGALSDFYQIYGPAGGGKVLQPVEDALKGYQQPAPQGVVRITNDAEYDGLPSGTPFIGPDGKARTKP